jgi:hypothetical protein
MRASEGPEALVMRGPHRRWLLRTFAASLLALVGPLTACETKSVTVQIPAFGAGAVDGIWLWRLSETSNSFERMCRIDIGDSAVTASGEMVDYIQDCEEHAGVMLKTKVDRLPSDPQTVVLDLWYMRWEDPGVYKASAYNSGGESALSISSIQL